MTGEGLRSLLSVPGRFARDTQGATATIFAIVTPVLVGAAALAIDVGVWTVQKRQAQGAADQAAYSAAVTASKTGSTTAQAVTEAMAIAVGMGFVDGADGVTVEVSNPPTAGNFAGQNGYWEVIVRQPQSRGLAALFLNSAPIATARAVAGGDVVSSGSTACVVSLNTSGTGINLSGNGQISNPACNVYSNSSSQSAVTCTGNGRINGSVYVVGGVSTSGNCALPVANRHVGESPVADPYADVSVSPPSPPSFPSCSGSPSLGGNDAQTLGPGNYCNVTLSGNGARTLLAGNYNISGTLSLSGGGTKMLSAGNYNINTFNISGNGAATISSGTYKINSLSVGAPTTISSGEHYIGSLSVSSTLTLAPGTYYIGSLSVSGGGTINATGGVTIILLSNNTPSISGNAVINITAPTAGPYAGIAIMGRASSTNTITFSGNTQLNIEGAMYFPNRPVSFSGNFNENMCTQIVVSTVSFSGNANMKAENCPTGIRLVGVSGSGGGGGGTTVALVE